jgi:hypothetical protein
MRRCALREGSSVINFTDAQSVVTIAAEIGVAITKHDR